MGLEFTVGVLGVLILSHAAYYTIQYRGLLKITVEEFSGPPMNVVLELILGFLLCMYAGLTVPGKFQSIHPDSEENSHRRLLQLGSMVYRKRPLYDVIIEARLRTSDPPLPRVGGSLFFEGIGVSFFT